jgi:NADH:ubiquinone oxidoreductase subunit E
VKQKKVLSKPKTATPCCCEEISDEEMIKRLDDVINTYTSVDGALIPVLQTAQNLFGYLPKKVLQHISRRLNISYSQVTGVVSFYSFFSTNPRGKNLVRVCLGTACYVRGGKEVLAATQKALGINVGETTSDRLFSLDVGRCFGACGLAPVVMINDDVHQRAKPAKMKELLNQYRDAGDEPQEDE